MYITVLYFSTWRTGDFRVRIKARLRAQQAKQYESDLSMLIPQKGEKTWGEKRRANKCDMVSALVGNRHRMNNGRDNIYMKKYLEKVSRTGLNKPKFLQDQEFIPLGAPLLDFLIEETKKIDGWKFLRLEELEIYH